MKLFIDEKTAVEVGDDATAQDLVRAAAPALGISLLNSVVVHEGRYLDDGVTLASLGYGDGSRVRIDERPPPCIHGSPFDPQRGYLCGWC